MKRKDFSMLPECPQCSKAWSYKKDGKVYSRVIGVEDPEIYDGVSWWMCPYCKTMWDRWTLKIVTGKTPQRT